MKKYLTWLFALLWLISLLYLQDISRTRFNILWAVYSFAFTIYLFLVFKSTLSVKQGVFLAILIRLACFFQEPLLSDDYYRFIWDGALTHAGINPATFTPREITNHPDWLKAPDAFFNKLNSPDYYAVYPPAAQAIFHLSFLVNGWNIQGHILFLRSLLFLADLIILGLLWRLLKQKNLPEKRILLYGLNPLIVLEFTGNLHFDGMMIMGLLAALYFADKRKYFYSSLTMAFSILAKMITLPLIPFLGKDLSRIKRFLFATLTLCLISLFFLLSFGQELHWTRSIALWLNHFEFNASIYYSLNGLGYLLKGYNTIAVIGPCLFMATIASYTWVLIRFYKGKILTPEKAMLFVLTFYLLFSTTVHPWYLGILLVLGILSLNMFPLVWTYLVYLSYSHYDGGLMAEHYPLIATEYILLGVFIYWELKRPFHKIPLPGILKS